VLTLVCSEAVSREVFEDRYAEFVRRYEHRTRCGLCSPLVEVGHSGLFHVHVVSVGSPWPGDLAELWPWGPRSLGRGHLVTEYLAKLAAEPVDRSAVL
jgi:hypothetical protein